jgi:hypothetical protein
VTAPALREAEAAKALRESYRAVFADDDALALDAIEGETGLFEAIDVLLVERAEAMGHATGLKGVESDIAARRQRFEKRADSLKGLIEQALMIAEIDTKVVRPVATLSMSKRPATVEVQTESEIPARFWKVGDPVLDKKALGAALAERAAAIAALPEDPDARAEALAALPPEIPGAVLSNAAPSLTIRMK